MSDQIHRFIFNDHGIRGQLVKLSNSIKRILQSHQYPEPLADLLQQTATVSLLLATTLKFEGKISLQLQTESEMKMLVVQTTHKLGFRGLVRFDENTNFSDKTFAELVDNGHMSITIEPSKGKRYQGIVPLDKSSIAECIEGYFELSEQLKTRLWLFNDGKQAFGLMLQALPDMTEQESFEHLACLADTLTKEESLALDGETLLHRLFHQENINLLSLTPVQFECGCSEKKMLESIALLDQEEIDEALASQGEIPVQCEFCLDQFSFDKIDIKTQQSIQGNTTQH